MGTVLSSACNCFSGSNDEKNSKLPSTSIENQSKLTSMTDFQPTQTEKNQRSAKTQQLIFNGEKPQLIGSLSNKKPTLDNFLIEKCLGRGAFGKVVLARHSNTKKLFAMKIIRKADIIQNQLVENIVLEKNILQKCNHPFLIKLKFAFQTNLKFYLVMEYIQGGELYTLIKKHRRFTEQQARFYFNEIILGIEYLHKNMNIIYRDLKPENVLLTKEGHVKLIDFGLAKRTTKKSNTLAGTPEYLAPEVLKGTPHGKEVDFWSLGVLLYEMLVGVPPFNDENRNFDKIMELIIKNTPNYPQFLSPVAQDLIKKLLVTNPTERLGSNDFNELKAHPFFNYVNWTNVFNKSYLPPFSNITATNVRQFMQPGKIHETYEQNIFDNLPGFTYNGDALENEGNNTSFSRRSKLNFGVKSNQMYVVKKDQRK